MTTKLLALYGLAFHPFCPNIPVDALDTMPAVDTFLHRVELTVVDGNFAVLTGDPGTGKTLALRLLAERMDALPILVTTDTKPTFGAET